MPKFTPGDHVQWCDNLDPLPVGVVPSHLTRDKFCIYLWADSVNYHVANVDISIYQANLLVLTKSRVSMQLDVRSNVGHQGSTPFMPGDLVQVNNGRWAPAKSSTNWFVYLYNYKGADMVYRFLGNSEMKKIIDANLQYRGIRMDRRAWCEETQQFLDPNELPD